VDDSHQAAPVQDRQQPHPLLGHHLPDVVDRVVHSDGDRRFLGQRRRRDGGRVTALDVARPPDVPVRDDPAQITVLV